MRQTRSEPNGKTGTSRRMFFAAYAGSSMEPTLRDPEIMEIVPYERAHVCVGDVVLFRSPEAVRPVVHRVVRVSPAGISTRGDNNPEEDAGLSHPEDVQGRVVAAWRGQRRREIAGGIEGRLAGRLLRRRRILVDLATRLLHPAYEGLSHGAPISGMLPASLRPRVVVFRARGQERLRLLWGRHVVGRFDDRDRRWHIRRPYRLLVDERVLRRPRVRRQTGRLRSNVHSEP